MTDASDISVAVLYPGNRVEKILTPLEYSDLHVEVEPDNRREFDFVIADNADTDLGKEVLKNPFTDTELIYRMRGDVYHELDLWDMNPVKRWIAKNIVLQYVDGVLAVSDRLAENYRQENANPTIGSAGLVKDPTKWPETKHTGSKLRCATLTNCNYKRKVEPLIDRMDVVDSVLEEKGGEWHICGKGENTTQLKLAARGYDNIEFKGYVDAKEKLQWANCMLHFSELDGQPNSVLEGFASEVPIITNDFAAFTQGNAPLLISESDATLERLLDTVSNPSVRSDMAAQGVSYLKTHHSLDAIAESYERYFLSYPEEA